MREFIKSVNSYSWAMSLFGLKQMQNMLAPYYQGEDKGPATKAMDAVTNATREQLGKTLDSTFKTGDTLQRFMTDITLFVMFPFLPLLEQSGTRGSGNGDRSSSAAPDAERYRGQKRARSEASGAPAAEPQMFAVGRKR